jgi:hypothetical protein
VQGSSQPARRDRIGLRQGSLSRFRIALSPRPSCAYPKGQFEWIVLRPATIPEQAPYSNASVAIVGEDAMKKRLVDEKAEVLGGEFFLADDWLVHSTWSAGNYAAEQAQSALGNRSPLDSSIFMKR